MAARKLQFTFGWFAFVAWFAVSAATAQVLSSVAETSTLDYTPLGSGHFYSFISPNLGISDASGPRLVFRADAKLGKADGGPLSQRGIFVDDPADPGSGALLVEQGGMSPDGTAYSQLRNQPFVDVPSVNSLSEAVWLARTRLGSQGLFRGYDEFSAATVALVGDDAGLSGETIVQVYSPKILDNGDVVFAASLRGGVRRAGYFICDSFNADCSIFGTGSHTPLVVPGDLVDSGNEICQLNRTVAASAYGIAFTAITSPSCGSGVSTSQGVFRMQYGGLIETIAESGGPAEPLASGGVYGRLARNVSEVAISDEGHVAFRTQLKGPIRGNAVYMCNATTCPSIDLPTLVVREGQVAPNGGTFRSFSRPSVNDFGDVAFQAIVRGGPGQGIYQWIDSGGSGVVEAIAERGDPIDTLGGFLASIIQVRHTPVMSPMGRVAFLATLRVSTGKRAVAILVYE